MFPDGNKAESLSIYLDVADADGLPEGWNFTQSFSLTLVNQLDPSKNITKGMLPPSGPGPL